MARYNYKVLDLDVDSLFEERNINEVMEIEKIIDVEIEKKRTELRSMVGDRYKDILTASDAIKSMKDISEHVVESIEKISNRCESLISEVNSSSQKYATHVAPEKHEERTIIIQIRLTITINDQIWAALDHEDYSTAAQFYLLAQHVHTGLRLMKKDILEQAPLLKIIKSTVEMLREKILNRVSEKLQSLTLTPEETSSNLNALMLLESHSSSELLKTFIKLRKIALTTVIQQSHSSVRHQVSAMVRCLTTTVHLLHDCFIAYKDSSSGLIWQQLEDIVNENAPPTLSKIVMPKTPLVEYIAEIIKQFRPKCCYTISKEWRRDLESDIEDWVKFTGGAVEKEVQKSLELVTSIKGLHIIREEALKIELPTNWDSICADINLPKTFNIWYYFFQNLVTNRAVHLISKKVSSSMKSLQESVTELLSNTPKSEKSETDLRWYTWLEENEDISRTENVHVGLSMKTKGYSPNIIKLCEKMDSKYLEILCDASFYLYGREYESTILKINVSGKKTRLEERKFENNEQLENHLRIECSKNSERFTTFLQEYVKLETNKETFIMKSLICARFLQAVTSFCPNFTKCCCCSNNTGEWEKNCSNFNKTSLQFWENWVEYIMQQAANLSSQLLGHIDTLQMLSVLPKWDSIEIQEQTDEKIFKSRIKVPSQPSLALQQILTHLSNNLSYILPHTLPKQVHLQFIEKSVHTVFAHYEKLLGTDLSQRQALQFLFDVKFLTTFCVARDNMKLVQKSQNICDKLRSRVDPFDLDVFYAYLQHNTKQSALQSQVILGSLLPSSGQLASLGLLEKNRDNEKEPSILALSVPSTTSWFPLLPVTAPVQKTPTTVQQKDVKNSPKLKSSMKKSESASSVRSGAAALFGAMTTDWFS